MPFVLKKYKAIQGKKIQHFLLDEAGLSASKSQKLLSKKRVFDDEQNPLDNGQVITGEYIQVAVFEGHTRGLKPIFEVEDFAVFDKPSGIMVHPTRKETPYCLLDEVRYHFGEEASLAHRIDAQTSGLVLVAKNKQSSTVLKTMFEHREYNKQYLALVSGQIKSNITIDKPIAKAQSVIRMKMTCEIPTGKRSKTHIEPLEFNRENNTTLVKAMPVTGRQHQIRVHLESIGHPILGDPIYGVSEKIANDYLCKNLSVEGRLKLTGAERLMLHANNLSFYYKDKEYDISSKFRKF
ncbi:RluA family pseudouridine synthase [Candidatus Thioglobus sp.]|jgi:23S rRNA pseudouridine1911/1915/1917 synthase|uniref:RluA family pseudouridine synthase n=1 Tax=Candidatus Thioglobus sp. TaxID=2026721 RepID=UPI001DA1BA24|nr:RluA family pseudouridine synthase [Candidatus Thioglobus sp.]MBT3276684.1 RluA family pseudouridine synthase [Candidatus Thioglobus sp.]MBT3447567.1 RluA family pseudouridine synthase [Candidatus Thioglobus sp.]MBT3744830.1 RluA family pseudouridine synthase [Candidatus Thioglobus sp.]MBT4001313.1 RluA family pseudouridine synthase [Candidatus Thioglobus sp.]MBT4746955.1 RluA family pseudouridine synthase [Candidatus Thioglobus sp.]